MGLKIVVVMALFCSVCGGGSGWSRRTNHICKTDACRRSAQDILSAMDRNVNPCDNFYQYACGRWIRNNPTQDGETSVDRYEKLRANNDEFVKNLMGNSQSRIEYNKVKTIIKTFDYYDSCMDVNSINNRGIQPIKTLLDKYDLWIDNNWDERNWNLEDVLIRLFEDLGTKAMFELNVELGMTNNSFYFISLKQPSKFSLPRTVLKKGQSICSQRRHKQSKLSTPRRVAPKKASFLKAAQAKRKSLYQFMVNVTRELGTGTTSVELINVIRFERKLAKIALPESDIDYKKINISELEFQLGISPIDWLFLLQQVIPTGHVTSDTVIIMNGICYFKELMKLINITPKRTLANYLMWKVVYDLHLKLGQKFWDLHGNYKASIGMSWTQVDREDICMEELSSLKGFALPLTRVFVDKKFKGGNKQWILRAIERIRNMFLSKLDDNTWMDYTTNNHAKTKARLLKEVVGYPDFIMNNTALDLEYNDIVIDKLMYFENHLSLVKYWTRKQYSLVGKPRDDHEWSMSPVEINAQYEDSFNRMVFPVAILQPPFYSGNYSSAVNFGGIGTIIGHELTHGFDDSGKNYDEYGRRNDWWSQGTLNEFHKKSKCLENQYDGYSFHGYKVDGKRSLSENIADNGGIKLALSAYRDWVQVNGDEPLLPKMHLTNEQIFFVSFAQNWCSSFGNDGIKQETTSNYSPTPVRVNGSLKNYKEFSFVFNCTQGTRMNPNTTCGLW